MSKDWSQLSSQSLVERLISLQRQQADDGVTVTVHELVEAFPQAFESTTTAVDLIYNEFLIRSRRGEDTPKLRQDYLRLFPQHASELERQFEVFDAIPNDPHATFATDPFEMFEEQRELLQRSLETSRFQLKEAIGEGTFATVYRAWDHVLRRWVAVKFSKQRFEGPSIEQERFTREAEAAAGLAHPGVVSVHEFGQSEGRAYIVQELVDGGTMKDRIARGDYSVEDAVNWVCQLAEAVDYAHQYGVVHRDLKPANILFDDRGQPKVADFGLAALMDEESRLTRHGDLIGTPAYMSPEQAAGESVTKSSDVYSLGVVLFELLEGTPPFSGPVASVIDQVMHKDANFGETARHHPTDLKAICLKAMSKGPTDRYESAAELAMDLRRFLFGESVVAKQLGPWEKSIRWFARRPALAGTICIATLLLFVIGLVSIVKIRDERQRFLDQRDIANARLVESLLANAEFSLQSRKDDWFASTKRYLDKVASLVETQEQLKATHEVLVEALSDDRPQLEVVDRWIGPTKPIESMVTTRDWIITGYADGTILSTHRESNSQVGLRGPKARIQKIACRNERDVFALADGFVWHWQLPSPEDLKDESISAIHHQQAVSFCLIQSKDKGVELVIGDAESELSVLNIETHQVDRKLRTGIDQQFEKLFAARDEPLVVATYPDFRLVAIDALTEATKLQFRSDDKIRSASVQDADLLFFTTSVGYRTDALIEGRSFQSGGVGSAPLSMTHAEFEGRPCCVTGTDDGSVILTNERQQLIARRRLPNGLNQVCHDGLRSDCFAVGNDRGEILFLRAGRNQTAHRFFTIHSLGFDQRGNLIVDNSVKRPFTGDSRRPPQNIEYPRVVAVDVAPNGVVAVGLLSNELKIVRPDGQQMTVDVGNGGKIRQVKFGFKGQLVWVSRESGALEVWDPTTMTKRASTSFDLIHSMASHTLSEYCFVASDQSVFRLKLSNEDSSLINQEHWYDFEGESQFLELGSGYLLAREKLRLTLFSDSVKARIFDRVGFETQIVDAKFAADNKAIFAMQEKVVHRLAVRSTENGFRIERNIQVPQESGSMSLAVDPKGQWVACKGHRSAVPIRFLDAMTLKVTRLLYTRYNSSQLHCWFANGDYGLGDWGLISIEREQFDSAKAADSHKAAIVPFDYCFKFMIPGGPWAARWDVDASPNGKWLAFGRHFATVGIVNAQKLKLERLLEGFPQEVWNVEFSPDSRWLATGSETTSKDGSTVGVLHVWDTNTWKVKYERHIGRRLIAGLAFHPTAPLLAISSFDGGLTLVDGNSGTTIRELLPGQSGARQRSIATMDVKFSDDGKYLAVSRKNEGAMIWKLHLEGYQGSPDDLTIEQPVHISVPGQRIWALAFDRTSKRLALASELGEVSIYEVGSFAELLTLRSGLARFRKLAFSPDNRILAASAWSATGIAWNVEEVQRQLDEINDLCPVKIPVQPVFLDKNTH